MAQLSKTDWLEQGLAFLAQEGVAALTIHALCQHLGVTKGSFYHHFENHEAFLEALLTFWEEKYTAQFIEASQQAETPLARLQHLSELVIAAHGTEENAIRAWAQTDPLAREAQERVDSRRIAYLTELQLALHDDEVLARSLAQLMYATLLGARAMLPPATQDELRQMFDLLQTLQLALLNKETP